MRNPPLVHALVGAVLFVVPSVTAKAESTPKKGGVLKVVVTPEPPGLVTGLITNTPTQMVSGSIFESLLRFSPDLKPIPALAESWAISSDETAYTFKLREGVLWHDGKPFNADDVLFSLNAFLPKVNPRWRIIREAHIGSIEKSDDHTVVIKLKQVFNPLLMTFENGSMPMVPRHIYEGTDYATNPMNNTPVGTGPMKFKTWVRGSHVELSRNENYYLPDHPRLDGAIYRFIPDAASRAIAFETGEVDVMTAGALENADIARLRDNPNVCVSTTGWELFAPQSYFQLNVRSGPLADKTFRKALMYALDNAFIKDAIWAGYGEIGTGPISPRTKFYPANTEPAYSYNPEKARELIARSGYKGETLSYLVVTYNEAWVRTAELAKQMFQDVGVNVELVSADAAGWNQRIREGRYDITNNWPYQYGDPSLGVERMWTSSTIGSGSPFSNTGGYSNPEVDKLFAQAAVAPADRRASMFAKLHSILADELPALWSIDLSFPTVYSCKVKDFVTTATGANDSLLNAWLDP
jgi:peptide/nickel transport system substrate-binding protein